MIKNQNHQAILDAINSLSKEQLLQVSAEVKKLDLGGPTIDEYFNTFDLNYHHLLNQTSNNRISANAGIMEAISVTYEESNSIVLADNQIKIILVDQDAEPVSAQRCFYPVNIFNGYSNHTA